ncbi:MAG: transporter [Candidatus Babeliaceae bacterium]|nr:transporter [Candidatus Babeliaceae bacterium]
MFVTRLELDVSFPTVKNEADVALNPGNGLYFINPYWAETFYFTGKCTASWRLQYVWSSINKKTHVQTGQAIFMNFGLKYDIF